MATELIYRSAGSKICVVSCVTPFNVKPAAEINRAACALTTLRFIVPMSSRETSLKSPSDKKLRPLGGP